MFYDYKCAEGHEQEVNFPIAAAAESIPCNVKGCNLPAMRQFTTTLNVNMQWWATKIRDYHKDHPVEIVEGDG